MNENKNKQVAGGQPQGPPSRLPHEQTETHRAVSSPVDSGEDTQAIPPALNTELQRYVDRIRAARRRTERLLEAAYPGHNAADASVAVAWEKVFDYLCANPDLDEPELTKMAGIIQKLSGAFNQLKALELKMREEARREAEHEGRDKDELPDALDPETLRRLEHQLKLL